MLGNRTQIVARGRRPCTRSPWSFSRGSTAAEYTRVNPGPSMPVCGHVSIQTSQNAAGLRPGVSCLRSILVGTGSVALPSQASEATLPRVASMAAPLSQGLPGERENMCCDCSGSLTAIWQRLSTGTGAVRHRVMTEESRTRPVSTPAEGQRMDNTPVLGRGGRFRAVFPGVWSGILRGGVSL